MTEFPKVLIISIDPFNKSNGTGITLSNLFEGWDKNSIAQIYLSDMDTNNEICNNYFRLKPNSVFWNNLFRKFAFIFRGKNSRIASPAAMTLSHNEKSIINKIHINLRALLDFSPIYLPKSLFQWIDQYDPDIIYSSLGNTRLINLSYKISKKTNLPFAPHFMDDWPNTLYTQNELLGLARIYFEKRLNKLFNRSNGGLCISELMSIEYQKRYNLPFSSFVNCVDDHLFFVPEYNVVNNKFTLVYMGGLHLNRWKCLLDISEVVEKINNNGNEVILKIYCPEQDNKLYSSYFQHCINTKFEESVKLEAVSDILKTASLLVHIESFDENIAQYTRFSLSTKIPQYMASGKPILGYGPNNLASMQHILKAEAGKIVIQKGVDELFITLNKLIHDHLKLNFYAQNGYEFSSKFHKKSKNIERLRIVLNSYKLNPK
jgi:hypothetical protein